MKNFAALFGYEMKKIWKRPLTLAVVLLMTALSVYVAMGALTPHIVRTDGGKFIPEADWNARMEKGGRALDGQAMDETFFQSMRESVPEFEDYNELERWFYHKDPTYYHAWFLADAAAAGDIHNMTAESFYAGRRALLEQRWENYGLTEDEKDYWREMDERVGEPYVYEYPWRGMMLNGLSTTLYTMIVPLALSAAVCLCQTFSEDRSTRVDALVFASRGSRLPLFLAKILAGAVSALIVAALILGAHLVVYLFRYGVQGLGAPLQMLEIVYSFPISVGQSVFYLLLITALYTLTCGALTMLLSALSRRSVPSLIIPVTFLFLLTQSRLTAPWLPHNLITWDGFLCVSLFRFLGTYLNIFQVGLLLYPLIAVVLLALCWAGWQYTARRV